MRTTTSTPEMVACVAAYLAIGDEAVPPAGFFRGWLAAKGLTHTYDPDALGAFVDELIEQYEQKQGA